MCSSCNTATKGTLEKNNDQVELDLEEGEIVDDVYETDQVLTIDPFYPTLAGAKLMSDVGGSPFIFNAQILEERITELQHRVSTYLGVIDTDWSDLRKLTRFFLDSNWDHFDALYLKIMDIDIKEESVWIRYDALYKLYDVIFIPLMAQPFLNETREEWNFFFFPTGPNSGAISDYQDQIVKDVSYLELRESLFNCVQQYIEAGDSILPGLVVDMYPNEHTHYGDLRIYRDDFTQLRDLYTQCFEACNHALTFMVEIINVVNRGNPEAYLKPTEVIKCPNNRNQFNKLNAQLRTYFLAELPEWYRVWGETLDRNLRNKLGHRLLTHDLSNACLTRVGETPIPYITFLHKVQRIIYPIISCLNAFKIAEIHHGIRKSHTDSK